MDIRLTFKITCTNGEETTQDISTPAVNDPNVPFDKQQAMVMQQMLHQYAQVGLLRQPSPNKFILMCPSQIAFVECELPSIVLANALDVPPAPKGGLITE